MLDVLIVVDRAVAGTGPHRNVVGSLNALAKRSDVVVHLVTGAIDAQEFYASSPNVHLSLGFEPHNRWAAGRNCRLIHQGQRKVDLIYVPSGLKALLYAQLARRPGRPLVAGPNVTPLPNRLHDSPGWIDLGLLCDRWIEASHCRADHVQRTTKRHEIKTIHHAIDHQRFTPDRASLATRVRYGLPVDRPLVLYVGKDRELKGVTQLLDAFDVVRDSVSCVLVLAGRMTERTLRRIDGRADIFALGFLGGEELADLYAAADVSVVPSSWENFPFTVLEAMASGLPVIASNVGGISEMIEDGHTGILLEVAKNGRHLGDASVLIAGALTQLLSDESLRAKLGENARKQVLAEFTEERLGKDLVELFGSLR